MIIKFRTRTQITQINSDTYTLFQTDTILTFLTTICLILYIGSSHLFYNLELYSHGCKINLYK